MWVGCFVRATEWVHHGTTVLCVSVDVYLWMRGSLKGMGWCNGECEEEPLGWMGTRVWFFGWVFVSLCGQQYCPGRADSELRRYLSLWVGVCLIDEPPLDPITQT